MNKLYIAAFLSTLTTLPLTAQEAMARPDKVPVSSEAASWARRDWKKCLSNAVLTGSNDILTVHGDTASVLFVQIPTTNGSSLPIPPDEKWMKRCDRPPLDFAKQVRKMDRPPHELISVSEYGHVRWRWRLNRLRSASGAPSAPDGLATVRLGINILRKNSQEIREIAYEWNGKRPLGSTHSQRTSVIPLLLSTTWHRIVVHNVSPDSEEWVPEARNLAADYRRLYKGEEPGKIVRIYLRVDSDTALDPIQCSFSEIEFHAAITDTESPVDD